MRGRSEEASNVLCPQLAGVDFRTDVSRLGVPVYVLDAGPEPRARRELALEWFALLDAPNKRLVAFETRGTPWHSNRPMRS